MILLGNLIDLQYILSTVKVKTITLRYLASDLQVSDKESIFNNRVDLNCPDVSNPGHRPYVIHSNVFEHV